MDDIPPNPPIDPTTYDLIVIGTGLPESIIAAAASATSKSVLHLDPNPFYGSHFCSIPLADLPSFLSTHSTSPSPPRPHLSDESNEFSVLDYLSSSLLLYRHLRVSPDLLDQNSRTFNLDVAGLGESLECAGFQSSIFRDRSLGLTEKNQLMRFFKLVQGHLAGEPDVKISDEDLQSPFVDFLNEWDCRPKLNRLFILYAIAMADYDQEHTGVCRDLLKTKVGIDQLALYKHLLAGFKMHLELCYILFMGKGNYPKLLPPCCCQRLHLCIAYASYCITCRQVEDLHIFPLKTSQDSGCYKGVRLASGQDIFSQKLIMIQPLSSAYNSESNAAAQNETAGSSSTGTSDPGEGKPTLLWSALYVQELTLVVSYGYFFLVKLIYLFNSHANGKLNYDDLVDATEKLFKEIYPEDEFFPQTSSENPEDDDDGEFSRNIKICY
ncbi:Kinase superfamily protein, 32 [Hibiscus syriacus]|uniref:Kinase superfamily protein, 32 n=1 Tax=Hibiscus syriacus TaxID=106335 RepID=A0A6A2ZV75_HIBSY|nr:Kinase superfamily protein, 32 [Hibiscus syriacus]